MLQDTEERILTKDEQRTWDILTDKQPEKTVTFALGDKPTYTVSKGIWTINFDKFERSY